MRAILWNSSVANSRPKAVLWALAILLTICWSLTASTPKAAAATVYTPQGCFNYLSGATVCAHGYYVCRTTADDPNYVGWGTLSLDSCEIFVRTMLTAPIGSVDTGIIGVRLEPVPAYIWNNGAWQFTQLKPPTQVYVYPFSGGWRWAWANGRWHAIRAQHIYLSVNNYT